MELKEYQQGVLRKIDRYLAVLAEQNEKVEKARYVIAEQGLDLDIGDPCQKAWDYLNKERLLPYLRDKDGNAVVARYLTRRDHEIWKCRGHKLNRFKNPTRFRVPSSPYT